MKIAVYIPVIPNGPIMMKETYVEVLPPAGALLNFGNDEIETTLPVELVSVVINPGFSKPIAEVRLRTILPPLDKMGERDDLVMALATRGWTEL